MYNRGGREPDGSRISRREFLGVLGHLGFSVVFLSITACSKDDLPRTEERMTEEYEGYKIESFLQSRWRLDSNGDGRPDILRPLPRTPGGSPMLDDMSNKPSIVTAEAKHYGNGIRILFAPDFEQDLTNNPQQFLEFIKRIIDLVDTVPESLVTKIIQIFDGTLIKDRVEGYYSPLGNGRVGIDVQNKNLHEVLRVLHNELYHGVYHNARYNEIVPSYLVSLDKLEINFPNNIDYTYEVRPNVDGKGFDLIQATIEPYKQFAKSGLAHEVIGDAGASLMTLIQIGINRAHNVPYSDELNPDISIYEAYFKGLLEEYWIKIERDLKDRGVTDAQLPSFVIAHLISVQPLLKVLTGGDAATVHNKNTLWLNNLKYAEQFFIDKLKELYPNTYPNILEALGV